MLTGVEFHLGVVKPGSSLEGMVYIDEIGRPVVANGLSRIVATGLLQPTS